MILSAMTPKVTFIRQKLNLLKAIYEFMGPLKTMLWISIGLTLVQSLWTGAVIGSVGAFLQTALIGAKNPDLLVNTAPAIVRPFVLALNRMPEATRLYWGVGLTGAALILAAVIKTLVFSYQSLFSARFLIQLRQRVFVSLCHAPMSFFDTHKKGALLQMVIHETQAHYVIVRSLTNVLTSGLNIALILSFMVTLSWPLCLAVTAIWFVLLYESHRMSRRIMTNSEIITERQRDMMVTADEMIGGIKHLKLLNHLDILFSQFDRQSHEADFLERRGNLLVQSQDAISQAIGLLCVTLIIGMNQLFTFVPLPALILFLYLLYRLIPLFGTVNQELGFVDVSCSAAERVVAFLKNEGHMPEAGGTLVKSPLLERHVTYQGVGLDYRNRKGILHDVTFTVPKGKMTALVGPSGAGKTSIANLLVRLYSPTEGTILIDDRPIHEFSLAFLRERIGMVSQETTLFNLSVRENLKMALPEATEAQMIKAAKRAYAHVFIETLPQAYNTIVGDRGVQLSGGQRQRLQIAQLFLKNPEILILDEATSALDSESEQYVQEAFKELAKDRTTFIIAHRLSTVRSAHQILVIAGGRVTAQGDWNSLMAGQALFSDMVHRQSLDLIDDLSPTELRL